MEGLDGRRLMEHLSAKDEVLTLARCITRIWSITSGSLKMNLQEAVFDKGVFREELRTQKLKVAKLEEQNLEITETRQELKDSRIMVHVKDVETQKFGTQLQKYKGRHERLRINRDDLAKELEKDKHDRKKPLEA